MTTNKSVDITVGKEVQVGPIIFFVLLLTHFCCKKCREDVLIASCHGGRQAKRSHKKTTFSSTENTHMCKSEFLRAPGSFFALCSHLPARLQKRTVF